MIINAIDVFRNLETGIMTLVNSADLYTLHLLSYERKVEVPKELIDMILVGNRVSGFTVDGNMYHPQEISNLEQSGLFRQIGEQILLATYTAAEVYLTEKFKEYLSFRLRASPPELTQKLIDRLSFRSLREISNHYFDLLGIHLPSYDFQIFTTAKSRSLRERRGTSGKTPCPLESSLQKQESRSLARSFFPRSVMCHVPNLFSIAR